MNQAQGHAQQGQPGPAQQTTAAAQAALAQAQAALAVENGPPGSEQAKGPDAGKPDAGKPGQPDDKPGQSNDLNGTDPGKPGDRAAQDGGPRGGTAGAAAMVQLPARDRQALQQSQAEKYPEEYGNMVEQYLRNLSDSQSK